MMEKEQGIADVMVKAVMTVDLNTNVKDCARAMAKRGVSCAVITQAGAAIGIVTERDLVSKVLADAVDPTRVLVRDIMSTPLITVPAEASVGEAAAMMAQYRVRRLVVVDGTAAMVGIITTGDIARSLAEKHGYREPKFNALARYRDGVEDGPYR
ncbi:MAG: CBS domain-containing protein [Thaumarchaeota archaeon]|nr:CBS domain-containing protein [Nitrososphaerota archaeon]